VNFLFGVDFTYLFARQGVEQPDKDSPLKVQKDVVMKHSAPLPSMHYSSYL